ncbi:MAG: hypothetical protein V2B16_10735 [bacterium]
MFIETHAAQQHQAAAQRNCFTNYYIINILCRCAAALLFLGFGFAIYIPPAMRDDTFNLIVICLLKNFYQIKYCNL